MTLNGMLSDAHNRVNNWDLISMKLMLIIQIVLFVSLCLFCMHLFKSFFIYKSNIISSPEPKAHR